MFWGGMVRARVNLEERRAGGKLVGNRGGAQRPHPMAPIWSLRPPSLLATRLKDGTELEMRSWPPVATFTITFLPWPGSLWRLGVFVSPGLSQCFSLCFSALGLCLFLSWPLSEISSSLPASPPVSFLSFTLPLRGLSLSPLPGVIGASASLPISL